MPSDNANIIKLLIPSVVTTLQATIMILWLDQWNDKNWAGLQRTHHRSQCYEIQDKTDNTIHGHQWNQSHLFCTEGNIFQI